MCQAVMPDLGTIAGSGELKGNESSDVHSRDNIEGYFIHSAKAASTGQWPPDPVNSEIAQRQPSTILLCLSRLFLNEGNR